MARLAQVSGWMILLGLLLATAFILLTPTPIVVDNSVSTKQITCLPHNFVELPSFTACFTKE